MIVAVVNPVVFVLRLLKKAIKTLKLFFCKQYMFLVLCIVKHIAIHVTLIVAWPEPEPLWSNGVGLNSKFSGCTRGVAMVSM